MKRHVSVVAVHDCRHSTRFIMQHAETTTEMVMLLADNDPEIHSSIIAGNRHDDTVLYVLPGSCSYLYTALRRNSMGLVRLLESGVLVNTRNESHGRMSLHATAYTGNAEMIRLLLEKGALATVGETAHSIRQQVQAP